MKRNLFKFVMYCLTFVVFHSVNARKKVDHSDFATEKDQKPHKAYPYNPRETYEYVGDSLEEDLALFREIPYDPQKGLHHFPEGYCDVNFDEEINARKKNARKKNARKKVELSDFATEKNQKPQEAYPYNPTETYEFVGLDFERDLAIFREIPYDPQKGPYYFPEGCFDVNFDEEKNARKKNARKKVDPSDFATEKHQQPQKAYPYNSAVFPKASNKIINRFSNINSKRTLRILRKLLKK